VYGGPEEVRWIPSATSVPGLAAPGSLVLVRDAMPETLVAERVPQGGFRAWWEDDALVLEAQTWYAVDNHLEVVKGSTAVAMRNQWR
jgi:hypothetical protein